VKPAPFAYKKARSLEEALSLLAGEPEARLLAGGQSLIAALNMRLSAPPLLIDINSIDGLARIETQDGSVRIGALVRHAQAERDQMIARFAPLFARALPHIAHPAVRNRGTIGGSIAYADPAAELPACLVALDGEVIARGSKGERVIAADQFFRGLF
jgi:carbon-monoxide dehydrogenase medium subunit